MSEEEISGEGRFARSFRLMGVSWRYLREEPKLLALPAISALAAVAVTLATVVPIVNATRGIGPGYRDALAAIVFALPLTFVTVFCNVGFLLMVNARERGEDPSVAAGLRGAAALAPRILGWSVLTWAVGTFFGLLQQIPVVGGVIGRLLGIVGGLAWGLATFFVVPVLVLDNRGVAGSVRRSATTFRARWGEAVVGNVGVGAVLGIVMMPGFALLIAGINSPDHTALLVTLGLTWMAPLIAASSALRELFVYQLYRESPDGPFAQSDLDRAVKPRKRKWFGL